MNRTLNLLAALVVLGGCARAKEAAQAPQPPEVSVVTVRKASVPVSADQPGRTSAYLVAQVRARVDGIVLKREFTEGSSTLRPNKVEPFANPCLRQANARTQPRSGDRNRGRVRASSKSNNSSPHFKANMFALARLSQLDSDFRNFAPL